MNVVCGRSGDRREFRKGGGGISRFRFEGFVDGCIVVALGGWLGFGGKFALRIGTIFVFGV